MAVDKPVDACRHGITAKEKKQKATTTTTTTKIIEKKTTGYKKSTCFTLSNFMVPRWCKKRKW